MKNYEEKEKKLDKVIKRLSLLTDTVTKMNSDIDELSSQKNQLLREKEDSDKKYQQLMKEHQVLKGQLEKFDQEVKNKFDNKNDFNQKIDELNQETENLIDAIDKWQT